MPVQVMSGEANIDPVAPFRPEASGNLGEGGCSRTALIGCGLATLILGLAAVVFLLKAGDIFAWAMGRFEAEIVEALPDDLNDAERQRLHDSFENASAAVIAGQFDPLALQRLQGKLRESLLEDSPQLSRQQVLELIELLEAVPRGERPPEAEPQPDDPPADPARVTA